MFSINTGLLTHLFSCKMSIIHRCDNNGSNKEGKARSEPLKTYNPQRDWLKYTQNGKSAEMPELLGSNYNSKLEMDLDGWWWCNRWLNHIQSISRVKGWSFHLISHPPNLWSKSPLQIHSEIMQSREGIVLLVKRNDWHDANDLQYAPGSPSLTFQRNRSSLLW